MHRQGQRIKESLSIGYATNDLARTANVKLRNQRDVLTNTINMVKDIGNELLRTERSAKELSMRRFLNLIVLYLVAILLFIAIVLVLYYKLFIRS